MGRKESNQTKQTNIREYAYKQIIKYDAGHVINISRNFFMNNVLFRIMGLMLTIQNFGGCHTCQQFADPASRIRPATRIC